MEGSETWFWWVPATTLTRTKVGITLVQEGDSGDSLYLIQKGKVAVTQEDGENVKHLATLESSHFFGEMSLFDEELRSATVTALVDGQALVLDQDDVEAVIHQRPRVAVQFLKVLSDRLTVANK